MKDTIHVIRSFGEAIAQRVGPQDSTTCTKYLFHRVATALWRGNSTLWMHRLPTLPPTVDGLLCVCVCIIRIGDRLLFQIVFGTLHELELAEKHQQGSSQSCL